MVTAVNAPVLAYAVTAVLLPPLAVYLVAGIGTQFWISVVLTILAWVPGVLHALWVVLSRKSV